MKRLNIKSHSRIKPRSSALLAALVGMAGVLSGAEAQTATAAWTTNGTRGTTAQPSVPITSNASGTWTPYDPPAIYSKTVTLPTQYLSMADGVKLAVNVTLPADSAGHSIAGAFPGFLQKTDYNAELGAAVAKSLDLVLPSLSWIGSLLGGYDPYIVKHGYVSIAVDGRGTGLSGGVWKAYDSDHRLDDDLRVLNWITAQPWSNGSLGVGGVSDVGGNGIFLGITGHPAIKAIISQGFGADAYRDLGYTGGQGNLLFFSYWFTITTLFSAIQPQLLSDPLHAIPIVLEQLNNSLTKFEVPTFLKSLFGDPELKYDNDFWVKRSPIESVDNIKAPTFLVTTAYDIWQRGVPLMYEALKHRVPTKLLVGNSSHFPMALNIGTTGDGVPIFNRIQLRWLDQYVKGLPVGADTLPNVTQNVLGYGHMATTTDWPHPQAKAQRYYLHGNGSLRTSVPSNSWLDPSTPRKLVQQPFGGICSISTSQWTLGTLNLLPLPCFSDDNAAVLFNLIYETPLLLHDTYINGPMQADIWAATTDYGASISVRIDDVDPSGNATPISNGLLNDVYRTIDPTRSRTLNGQTIQPWHAFTQASAQPVVPNQPMKLSVEIFPGSALLKAGHRLRVAIGPSNIPQGAPTGADLLLQTPIGKMTVYNDPAHPSSIVLPLVPTSALH